MSSNPHALKMCPDCGETLTLGKIHGGRCNKCHAREYRKRNPEKIKASSARYRAANLAKDQLRSREYYKKHREILIERQRIRDMLRIDERRDYNRKYAKDNRGRMADYYRAWRLAKTYGISMDQYADLLAAQKGLCAICDTEQQKVLHVDHDHATGLVRGLLCLRCNTALALLESRWLNRAQDYLNAHYIAPPHSLARLNPGPGMLTAAIRSRGAQ